MAEHFAVIEGDRQFADNSLTFASEPPVEVSVGGLPGLRYRFMATLPDGTPFERYVGYVTTDGAMLHVFLTGIISGDYAGVFAESAALSQFEPYLEEIIQNLSLTELSMLKSSDPHLSVIVE